MAARARREELLRGSRAREDEGEEERRKIRAPELIPDLGDEVPPHLRPRPMPRIVFPEPAPKPPIRIPEGPPLRIPGPIRVPPKPPELPAPREGEEEKERRGAPPSAQPAA